MSDMTDTMPAPEAETKMPGRLGRIYQGRTTVDFVGRKRTWFTISIIIIVIGLASLSIRGFNLGIDFKGGTTWQVAAPHSSVTDMTKAVEAVGLHDPIVEKLGSDHYQVSADIKSL